MVTAQLVPEGSPGLRAGLPEMGILELRSEMWEVNIWKEEARRRKSKFKALKQEQEGKVSKKAKVGRV